MRGNRGLGLLLAVMLATTALTACAADGIAMGAATASGAPSKTPRPTETLAPPSTGALVEWEDVKPHIAKGQVLRAYHPDSGISIQVVVVAIGNHFDYVPRTEGDTAKLKQIYDGQWAWTRKPMLVLINKVWVAASTNGMPHTSYNDSGKIHNGLVGVLCMHFLNSRTSETKRIDAEHQRCVQRAAGIK